MGIFCSAEQIKGDRIASCFTSKVEIHHTQDIEGLKELIETFKLRTENLVENDSINGSVSGENKIMDHLIVMDDISGLADSCKEFADFLTITQKYWYHDDDPLYYLFTNT